MAFDYKEYMKQYRTEHKKEGQEYLKKYYKKHKMKILKQVKLYQKKNKEKIIQQIELWNKKKLRTDLNFRILWNLRSRLSHALKRNSKSKSTKKLLGCTIQELKKHLEKQFKKGMTWNNYGLYGWHIDHIKPCTCFDLIRPEEQRECFHYSNLQPLWAIENLKKSNNLA